MIDSQKYTTGVSAMQAECLGRREQRVGGRMAGTSSILARRAHCAHLAASFYHFPHNSEREEKGGTQMSNEWYTPAKYVEAARRVMGRIDLDPASCEFANGTVGAEKYYTKEENGLMQPWYGRVWLNPPYGRCTGSREGKPISHQQAFAERLQLEYARGTIDQAVLLSLGNANAKWFQPLLSFTLCFPRGHCTFYRSDGSFADFGFPCAFVYLGPNEDRFTEIFSQFGRIVRAIDTPAPRPIARELWQEVSA